MISCTEFIPCYSELFTWLEEKSGREEVSRFWNYLFQPDGNGIPLISFVKKEGIRGCWTYWSGTLNEEAADFTMYLNEKRGFFLNIMHRCPSKGRLLQLADKTGLTPYHDYCLHCDCYRAAIEQVGLKYIYNFAGTEHASCSMLIFDPKVFDGRIIIDENTESMERKAADNEYFHRDFHSSMNMGIEYVGSRYGKKGVEEFLTQYTRNVYRAEIKAVKKDGLAAIEKKILDTYKKEHAESVVSTSLEDNALHVAIAYCPAVKHLRETGRTVSSWYPYTTETVMKTLADEGGFHFSFDRYEELTGAAEYHFRKQS